MPLGMPPLVRTAVADRACPDCRLTYPGLFRLARFVWGQRGLTKTVWLNSMAEDMGMTLTNRWYLRPDLDWNGVVEYGRLPMDLDTVLEASSVL